MILIIKFSNPSQENEQVCFFILICFRHAIFCCFITITILRDINLFIVRFIMVSVLMWVNLCYIDETCLLYKGFNLVYCNDKCKCYISIHRDNNLLILRFIMVSVLMLIWVNLCVDETRLLYKEFNLVYCNDKCKYKKRYYKLVCYEICYIMVWVLKMWTLHLVAINYRDYCPYLRDYNCWRFLFLIGYGCAMSEYSVRHCCFNNANLLIYYRTVLYNG